MTRTKQELIEEVMDGLELLERGPEEIRSALLKDDWVVIAQLALLFDGAFHAWMGVLNELALVRRQEDG